MRDLTDEGRTFSVHPASGYLSFADNNALWRNPEGQDLPTDREAVVRVARGFIEDANRRIASSKALSDNGVLPPFPQDLRPVWLGGVVPKGNRNADHCLCQFGVFLTVDGERSARVEGAVIDVRVGRGGRIIGLTSRWRAISGDILSRRTPAGNQKVISSDAPMVIRLPQPATPGVIAPIELAATEQAAPRELLYWLEDEYAPQTYLSPIYLDRDQDDGDLQPACFHSFRVEVLQRSRGPGIDLRAEVTGGSGSFEYLWGYWTAGDLFNQGIQIAGTSQEASLGTAGGQILLRVRDRVTGVVKQVEKQLFGSMGT